MISVISINYSTYKPDDYCRVTPPYIFPFFEENYYEILGSRLLISPYIY